MISEKQLKANRANALKSTGPNTAAGKTISSKNATTHGLRSCQPVIDGEDPAKYNDFRNDMVDQFAPVGPMECLLVDRIVHSAWRLRRIGTIEAEVFDFLRHPAESQSNKKAAPRPSRHLPEYDVEPSPQNRFASFNEARDAWLQTEDGILYTQGKWPTDPNYPKWSEAFERFKNHPPHQPDLVDDPKVLLEATGQAKAKTDSSEVFARLDQMAEVNTPIPLGQALAEDMQNNRILTQLTRYETSIERSMFKNLKQLQSLQLKRSSAQEIPIADDG